MIWFIIAYILSIPVCAFLMFALTANWYRSDMNHPELGVVNILYDDDFHSERKRCSLISIIPIANLTTVVCYYIIQLLISDIVMSTPIDKFFRKLYRSKYLLNRVSEEI